MRIFTTGQAAKMLGCAHRTVCSLFDRKKIMGYKINADRRIPEEDLRAYMVLNGIPTDRLDAGVTPTEKSDLEKRVERLERILGIKVDVA